MFFHAVSLYNKAFIKNGCERVACAPAACPPGRHTAAQAVAAAAAAAHNTHIHIRMDAGEGGRRGRRCGGWHTRNISYFCERTPTRSARVNDGGRRTYGNRDTELCAHYTRLFSGRDDDANGFRAFNGCAVLECRGAERLKLGKLFALYQGKR